MKALVAREFGPPDSLRVEEWPAPTPGPHDVVVRVHAAGLNFADLLEIAGNYQHRPELPFVPGKECAGIVTTTGPDVSRVKPGDRVLVQLDAGAFATKACAEETRCHLIPEAMDFPRAAALGVAYMTAHFALVERAALKPGEVVLVTGATGGVGMAAVQIAKALGATVLAAVSTPEKGQAAKASGADHIIDTSVANLRDALRDQVYAAVGKRGADVIIETVGGDAFVAAMRAIAWSGRMLVIGFASGQIPEVKAGIVLVKNISVIGLAINDYYVRQPAKFEAVTRELIDMSAAGKIDPHIMATFPLERFAEAMALMQTRQVIGKVIFTPN